MPELIPIREAARRLGVSDTAVRKAIAVGRVLVAGKNQSNGRPLLAWPDCENQWQANSDSSKRTHVGGTGSSERRAKYSASGPVSPVKLDDQPAASRPKPAPTPKEDADDEDDDSALVIHDGMTLTEAKTAKAIYDARKARREHEEAAGLLVRIEEVRASVFKMCRIARDQLLTMEDRLSPILASQTDITEVRGTLRNEARRICEKLAKASEEL